jgi:hypothetical protein
MKAMRRLVSAWLLLGAGFSDGAGLHPLFAAGAGTFAGGTLTGAVVGPSGCLIRPTVYGPDGRWPVRSGPICHS